MADDNKNQGEGNKTADEQYRKGATTFAKQGGAQEKALQAEQEVEKNPQEFAEAERKGRSHGAGELKDDLSWSIKKEE